MPPARVHQTLSAVHGADGCSCSLSLSHALPPFKPVAGNGPKKASFEVGLFDCFGDIGTFIVACFVPCVTYGQNQQRANNKDSCFVDGCIYCCCMPCLSPCIGTYGRGKVADRVNVDNNMLGDFAAHCCCLPCALTQESRELDRFLGNKH
ncbi:PLAC8 family-domain-containing protein [Entophlyctis helioformis]|nr:PLAC8 family-domain-containing protein [Entophlyctis helioformis]